MGAAGEEIGKVGPHRFTDNVELVLTIPTSNCETVARPFGRIEIGPVHYRKIDRRCQVRFCTHVMLHGASADLSNKADKFLFCLRAELFGESLASVLCQTSVGPSERRF